MIVVAIVGGMFAGLAVCSVWVRTQDSDKLREMDIVLGYTDEHAGIRSPVGVQQHDGLKRRTHARTTQVRTKPVKTATRAFTHKHARQH